MPTKPRTEPAQVVKATGEPVSFMRTTADTWGILSDLPLKQGQSVDIRKRSGEVVRVLVGRLHRRHGMAYLYRQGDDGIDLALPQPVQLATTGLLNGRSMNAPDCSEVGEPRVAPVSPIPGSLHMERVCVAVVALARGCSVRKAARASRLSEKRVRDLRNRGASMTPAELLEAVRSELLSGAVEAARTLRRVATDPTLDPFAQLRAADSILDRTVGKAAPVRSPSAAEDPTPTAPPDLELLRNALASAPPRPVDSGEE